MMDLAQIKAEAVTAAQEFLNEAGPVKLPVDVFALAIKKNIEVEREILPDEISGFFKRYGINGKPVIVVNETHGEVRKRFTVAHELGHFVLHKANPLDVLMEKEKIYFRQNTATPPDVNEIAANAFAGELLMPTSEVIGELQKRFPEGITYEALMGLSDDILNDLAGIFNVSPQAMKRRTQSLF